MNILILGHYLKGVRYGNFSLFLTWRRDQEITVTGTVAYELARTVLAPYLYLAVPWLHTERFPPQLHYLPTVYTTYGLNSSPIPFYSTYLTNHVTQLFEIEVKEFEAHLRGKLPVNLAQGDLHHSVCIMQLHKVGPGLPHFFAPQLLWSINLPILGLECWLALSRFNLLCNFGRLVCYFRLVHTRRQRFFLSSGLGCTQMNCTVYNPKTVTSSSSFLSFYTHSEWSSHTCNLLNYYNCMDNCTNHFLHCNHNSWTNRKCECAHLVHVIAIVE